VEYLHPAYPFQRAPYQFYNVTYAENIGLVDPFRPALGRASSGELAARLLTNAASMAVRVGEGALADPIFFERMLRRIDDELGAVEVPQWPALIPSTVLSAWIMLGIAHLVRRREWLLASYILGTLGLICLTPWPSQFPRYLAPLTPFLGVCLSLALLEASPFMAGRAIQKLVVGMLAGGVLATQAYVAYAVYRYEHPKVRWEGRPPIAAFRLFFYDDSWRSFDACLDWLKAHATAGEVVATSVPHHAYLRTGLKAVMPPMEVEVAEAQRLLDAVPVRYIIVDNFESPDMARRYAAPVVRSRPDLWELASPLGGSRIYRRR
jgi:hypothetical protein